MLFHVKLDELRATQVEYKLVSKYKKMRHFIFIVLFSYIPKILHNLAMADDSLSISVISKIIYGSYSNINTICQ